MSNIVHIGEHIYKKPELTRESEVLFVNAKKNDAYWRREVLLRDYKDIWFEFIPHFTLLDQTATLYDKDGALITLNKEDSDYIRRTYEQEFRRRTDGVWFKNGDEFEYITGDHYFLLMWSKMKVVGGGEYPDYREFQRDFFYLIQKAWDKNERCLGVFFSKAKKTGITNLMWSGYYLNKATLYRNKNMGCMNINQKQASKTFRDYFLYSYRGLPSPLKPQVKSEAPAEGKIDFGMSYTNSKANRKIAVRDADTELGTSVMCVSTAPKAFDVAVMDDTWYDEAPKYEESFKDIFTTNKEAVKMGGYVNGRVWITSYTPDEDGQSFREAREIFLDSKLKTIKETGTGTTRSELWAWHIPSHVSWLGENKDCFDKYGKCDQIKANREIDKGRKAVENNSRSLQAIKRQYAKDEREAWSSAGSGSVFDLNHLGELLADLELNEEHDPASLYVEGNLVWENPLWEIGLRTIRKKGQFCNVKFQPLTQQDKENKKTATIRQYHEIPKGHQNIALKQGRDEYGNLLPPPEYLYSLGGDPTAHAAKSTLIEYSKNSGMVMRMPDPLFDARMGKVVTNTPYLEYYDRPELPKVTTEMYLKLIIYTGALATIEGNIPDVATELMEEGMGHYMLVNDENKIMTIWKPYMGLPDDTEKTYTFIKVVVNQTLKNVVLELMVKLYKQLFHKPESDEEVDYGKIFKSARVIKQMMDLDASDTTKSDAFMGCGYALIGISVYGQILMENQDDNTNPEYYQSVLNALGWNG